MDYFDFKKVDDYLIRLSKDELVSNPRGWATLGTLCMFHPDYNFPNEVDINPKDFSGLDEIKQYIKKELKGVFIHPIYLYDHTVLYIKIGDFSGMLPQGHKRWDSMKVGYIFTTVERLKDYWPYDGSEKELKGRAGELFENEIDVYNKYVNGAGIQYSIEYLPTSKKIDVCGGFFDRENAYHSAKDFIKDHKKMISLKKKQAVKNFIKKDVSLEDRQKHLERIS
ncbi:MAG: hypothetical protein K9K32_00110 [Halanaerobiales bacterium]|nr:hypothetical protein [Halanaerobiales bacterium]